MTLQKIAHNTAEIAGGASGPNPFSGGIVQVVEETDPAGGIYSCADLKTDNVFLYKGDGIVTASASLTLELPANPRILQEQRIASLIDVASLTLNADGGVIGSVGSLTANSTISLQCIDETSKQWIVYCVN